MIINDACCLESLNLEVVFYTAIDKGYTHVEESHFILKTLDGGSEGGKWNKNCKFKRLFWWPHGNR